MQCGGSINCPIQLQNTSLCGDRKVSRIHRTGTSISLPGNPCMQRAFQPCSCNAMSPQTCEECSCSFRASEGASVCLPQPQVLHGCPSQHAIFRPFVCSHNHVHFFCFFSALECNTIPVMCSIGHASTQHLAANATTPTTGSASPRLLVGTCHCHSPQCLPWCPLHHHQASCFN